MDQQRQDAPKKKRPYHHHRPKNNGGQNNAERIDNNQNAQPKPPAEAQGNRPQNKGRSGDIHTRRGAFHPAPDATHESGKKQDAKEPRNDHRDNRENREPRENRDNRDGANGNNRNRNRGGKGHQNDNRPPRDGAPKEPRHQDGRATEEQKHQGEGRNNHRGDRRDRGNDRNGEPRNDRNAERSNDRNAERSNGRGRRSDNRPAPTEAPRRERTEAPHDAEMDSWFAPTPTEPHADPLFPKPQSAAEQELPHIELDLNDILPPIALERYEKDAPKPEEPLQAAEQTGETVAEEIAQIEVIGVRFNKTGKVYYFDPKGNSARRGDCVIVETTRGPEFGEVWQPNHAVSETEIVPPLRPVIRMADEKDIAHNAENRKREDEAFRICLDKIRVHGLDMKLVDAQYTFDNSKLLFYFTSAGRVDFRDLVKDLASVFRTRIELRQIGIRDEAKLMGGLGICGRSLCCASFLSDFTQVSIKMAKEQNLSLNSAKISGTCGRLMCCLNYEYPVYCDAARHTPSQGTTVNTPDGIGTVIEVQPLAQQVKVALSGAPIGTVPKYYRCSDIKVLGEGRRHAEPIETKEEE